MPLRVLSIVAGCLMLPGLSAAEDAISANQTTVNAFNEFSWRLFGNVKERNQNLVISPIGAASVLAIAADGARGETRDEILRTLGLKPDAVAISELMKEWKAALLDDIARDRAGDWRFAHSIWLDTRIDWDKAFATRWKATLGCDIRPASFARAPDAVARAINDWSNRQTKGTIPSVVSPDSLDRDLSLLLVSAVFLEKQWLHKFKPEETRTDAFHLNDNKSVQHPLMFQVNRFHVLEATEFQAIELPYKDSAAAMVVLLPQNRDGLEKLESSLDSEQFANIWAALQKAKAVKATTGGGFFSVETDPATTPQPLEGSSWDIETELTLPRFHLRSDLTLINALKSLGINLAFDRNAADLSGLLSKPGTQPVFVTQVAQQAVIEVDEQGTRAGAVTKLGLGFGGAPPKRAIFRADHPFLFVIVHRTTGAVLFLGRVCNPAE